MKVDVHFLLFVVAAMFFFLAALPTGMKVRCEWLAFACLTVAYVV
ncbi:MAG: hypothetical protein ABI665_03740 [Vicinamibacterales bacterium]